MDENTGHPSPESCSGPRGSSPKRSTEAARLSDPDEKLNRKRAPKACQSCRSRKVRCGVSDHGVPCHKCKLDNLECIVLELISEAVLRVERSSSGIPTSVPERALGASHCSWEKAFMNSYEEDLSTFTSPFALCQTMSEEHSVLGDDASAMVELPACGDELARWFSVIPPRVVDKMFNRPTLYPTGLNVIPNNAFLAQSKIEKSTIVLLKNTSPAIAFLPSLQTIHENCFPNLPEPHHRHPENHPTRKCRKQVNHQTLQQLLDDYAAAIDRVVALEEAIQKVDGQFTRRHNNSKIFPLTPPPESQASFVMNMQIVQQLEALLVSVQKGSESRPHKQGNASHRIQEIQNITAAENEMREDEFQTTFQSLMDFGAGGGYVFFEVLIVICSGL
ncbi:hypothetical protein AJ78_03970 [Emergomyces pasteurianus Ep9510]|uniref:Zn(2)-C6 fungal-type domain-containing protein n=1 Tax=Emergomyces pasteurianus Ep9510 TaxID=1447872 RepID=A0A1J9PIE6_9EURO|nr:hypothetical protein AJ78_03970 [Emergomyces pasteurianus Ep9510]